MPMPAHQETTATVDHLSRRMWRALEPYHALVYFIPETRQRTDALGLKGGWMSYFGTRAARRGRRKRRDRRGRRAGRSGGTGHQHGGAGPWRRERGPTVAGRAAPAAVARRHHPARGTRRRARGGADGRRPVALRGAGDGQRRRWPARRDAPGQPQMEPGRVGGDGRAPVLARLAGRAGRADRGRPGRPRRGRVAHRRADEANLGRARRRAVLAAGVAAAADPRPDPRGRRLPGPQPARPHLIDSVGRTGYAGVQDRRPEAGSAMAIRRPEADDLRRIARDFHFTIPDERMPVVQALVEGLLGPYDRLDELEEPLQAPRHPRDGGSPPRPEENPFGAWAWRVHIAGAAAGP